MKKNRPPHPVFVYLGVFLAFITSSTKAAVRNPSRSTVDSGPKLVVVISIDQFRADYLTRFSSQFLPKTLPGGRLGGFEYLKSKGAYFPFAQYGILQCMTGPGHATLLTGSYPYSGGVALNHWFDVKQSLGVYCAEDKNHKIVGAKTTREHLGTSPRNMIASTVGDELKLAGFSSKVVSVALKDRAAIFMGGHLADLALWLDGENAIWVTSSYYLPNQTLPDWVKKLNEELTQKKQGNFLWREPEVVSGLTSKDGPASPDAKLQQFLGRSTLPYSLDRASPLALNSPFGVEMTEEAAERAVDAMQLGRGKATDLLAIGFSTHDYVGHAFGPNRLEMEALTLEEDKAISKFLNFLNGKIPGGLSKVVVVLTADHGIAPNPDFVKSLSMQAGRVNEEALKQSLEERLSSKWGKPDEGRSWIAQVAELNFWIDRKTLAEKKLALEDVELEIKNHLSKHEGIAYVLTSADYEKRTLPPGLLGDQVMRTYIPGRSGDVIAILQPYYITGRETTTHLTGYRYDSSVPILFLGRPFRAIKSPKEARVIDIAPTLSYVLGILPPSLSEGRVLDEALK